MLYTIKDVRLRLSEISTRYIKVEVDGEVKGIALMSDLQEQMRQYGDSSRRRIKRLFLSGSEYDVNIGINLYPLSDEEFWEFIENRINRIDDRLKSIRDASIEVQEDEVRRSREVQEHKPLVHWDSNTGLIHFDKETEEKKIRIKKKTPEVGLFARFKRWLKGDRGWKR